MRKTKGMKLLSGVTGAAALLSSCVVAAEAEQPVQLNERAGETYEKVANVKGTFSFVQDFMTPPDEVFNLFGTAATFACAKPGFAFDKVNHEDYYVNVGGNIKKSYTVNLMSAAEQHSTSRNMMCSCAMGTAIVNARVTGVPVSDMISMAELEDGVNTITFKDSEGYGLAMPLSYVLEKDALLVYKVGDTELPEGTQVWMPDTVAKYFTRQVTDIELTAEKEVPEVEKAADDYRAKVSIVSRFQNSFKVGDAICFEGYADDCGTAIDAVEFSLDGGETWTRCLTKGADPHQWVYWSFEYVAEAAGTYKMDVRARNAEGLISPLASSIVFTVE